MNYSSSAFWPVDEEEGLGSLGAEQRSVYGLCSCLPLISPKVNDSAACYSWEKGANFCSCS